MKQNNYIVLFGVIFLHQPKTPKFFGFHVEIPNGMSGFVFMILNETIMQSPTNNCWDPIYWGRNYVLTCIFFVQSIWPIDIFIAEVVSGIIRKPVQRRK